MGTRTEAIPTTADINAVTAVGSQLQEALVVLFGVQSFGQYAAPSLASVIDGSLASIDSSSSELGGQQTTFSRNALSKKPTGKLQKLGKVETSLFGDTDSLGLFAKLRALDK